MSATAARQYGSNSINEGAPASSPEQAGNADTDYSADSTGDKQEDEQNDRANDQALVDFFVGLKKLWAQLQTPPSEPRAADKEKEKEAEAKRAAGKEDDSADDEDEQEEEDDVSSKSGQGSLLRLSATSTYEPEQLTSGRRNSAASFQNSSASHESNNDQKHPPTEDVAVEPLSPRSNYSYATPAASPPLHTPKDTECDLASTGHHTSRFFDRGTEAPTPVIGSSRSDFSSSIARSSPPHSPQTPTYDIGSASSYVTGSCPPSQLSVVSPTTSSLSDTRAKSAASADSGCAASDCYERSNWASGVSGSRSIEA